MKTIETTIYKFEELSEDAQKVAVENCQNNENYLDYEWYDGVYNDAKMAADIMGIDIENIYFSGFCSQGDGACFTGYYKYKKESVKKLKEFAPKDEELHRIVTELAELQRKNFYSIGATIKHIGRYNHENSTEFNIYHTVTDAYFPDSIDDQLKELLRDFMRWIYKRLNTDYDYLMGDASVKEHLIANDYDFTEDGKRY